MIDGLAYFLELKWEKEKIAWEKFRYLNNVPQVGKSNVIMWDVIMYAFYGIHPTWSMQLVDIDNL